MTNGHADFNGDTRLTREDLELGKIGSGRSNVGAMKTVSTSPVLLTVGWEGVPNAWRLD